MLGRLREVVEAEGVNATEDGVQALLRLSLGDMRKTLNVLQTTAMSYDVVNEENVYMCVGAALPREIDEIFHSLLNDSFADCFKKIRQMQTEKGLALVDIVQAIHLRTVGHQFPNDVLAHLFTKLAGVEYRCASATNDRLQLSSMIGAFQQVRSALVAMAT
jgi:replication factor C subunit 3/5